MRTTISVNRSKEENRDLVRKARAFGIENYDNLEWLGYEVDLEVDIRKDGSVQLLFISGVDVSDKNIIL